MIFSDEKIKEIGEKIIPLLKLIYDPEIPVDIYELGLIYDVLVSDRGEAKIIMTLTSPNCPVAESLPVEIKNKVKEGITELNEVTVEITFEPPWDREMMSEQAKFELGML